MKKIYSRGFDKYFDITLYGAFVGCLQSIYNKYFYQYSDVIGYIRHRSISDEKYYDVFRDLQSKIQLDEVTQSTAIYNAITSSFCSLFGGISSSIVDLSPTIYGVLGGILNVKMKEYLSLGYNNLTDFLTGFLSAFGGAVIAKQNQTNDQDYVMFFDFKDFNYEYAITHLEELIWYYYIDSKKLNIDIKHKNVIIKYVIKLKIYTIKQLKKLFIW